MTMWRLIGYVVVLTQVFVEVTPITLDVNSAFDTVTKDAALFCPSADDLTIAYKLKSSHAQLFDQGWTVNGGGAVATKSAFNLLGGYVEYDIDLSGVPTGVNANIYSISPAHMGGAFDRSKYCDAAGTPTDLSTDPKTRPFSTDSKTRPWCVEVDWIESNGNCGGATTLHTRPGRGKDGCTHNGCASMYHYNGRASFHMRLEFTANGTFETFHDGRVIRPDMLSPVPGVTDWSVLHGAYSSAGAVIYSSVWNGWTPLPDCGGGGNMSSAKLTVKNLRIKGVVVQGPTPVRCT